MAENKKSFILYADLINVVTKLVLKDRENKTNYAGELFLTILEYVNDKNPIPIDFIVEMAFEPIKLALKRDLKKYETYIEKQKVNGAKGGRPKKTQLTQALNEEPKKADSDNDNDNDTNNKADEIEIIYNKFVDEVVNHGFDSKIEVLYMTLRIKHGSLTPLLKQFKGVLIKNDRIHKTTRELFTNFDNWLNVQDRVGKLDEYKK